MFIHLSMSFKEDFSQLLKIQLLSQFPVEVDDFDSVVTVFVSEDSNLTQAFSVIKECSIVCYKRLIYRKNLSHHDTPLTLIVKAPTKLCVIELSNEEYNRV
jgi:hypothetical protein